MRKDILCLVKQSFAYGMGHVLIRAVSIFLIPIYTRVLTVSDYGIINTLAPLSVILMIFYNLGLSGAVMRYDSELLDDKERKIAHGTAFVFLLLISLSTSVLLILVGPFVWKIIFPDIPMFPFAPLILGTVVLSSANVIPMALLRIRGKAITFSILQFIHFLFVTSMIVVFVVVMRLGAKGQFIALLLDSAVFAIIFIIITMRDIKININVSYLRKYLSFGLPMIPSGLSIWVLSLSNILILQKLTSLEEVGLFGLGYKFGNIMDIFVVAIITAFEPLFYNKAVTKDGPALFSQIATYYLFVIAGVGLAILLGVKQVLHIATTPEYFDAERVVFYIIIGIVFRALYLFNILGIGFMKKTKYLPFIDGMAAVLNITLCVFLIPKYGMVGAAISTMTAYFLQLTCSFIVSMRLYHIPYQYIRLIKIMLIYAFVFIGLSQVKFDSDILTLGIRITSMPFLVITGLLILRVAEEKEILTISHFLKFRRL